jgi:Icc-related predicted phosphoesterase
MFDWFIDKIIDHITHRAHYVAPSVCMYVPPTHYRAIMVSKQQLPLKHDGVTRVVVVSDTHGMHEKLGPIPEGDVFVYCGDILMVGRLFSRQSQEKKLALFNQWLGTIPCTHKIVIAGNHDELIQKLGEEKSQIAISNGIYLENKGVNLCGLSFWGTPWSELKLNSSNRAFQNGIYPQVALDKKPDKVDVLITHGYCPQLATDVDHRVHLWGHAHHSFGIRFAGDIFRNEPLRGLSICSAVPGANYSLANGPIVVDILKEVENSKPKQTQKDNVSAKVTRGNSVSAMLKGIFGSSKVGPAPE